MSGGRASCWVCLAVTLLGVLTPEVKALPKTLLDGSKGTHFILGFCENFYKYRKAQLIIVTKWDWRVKVIVSVPLMRWYKIVFVRKNHAVILYLPNFVHGSYIEKGKRGVLVRASATVSVYGNSMAADGADMFLGIPVPMLGLNYYTVTYKTFPTILVVGTDYHTVVRITLPTDPKIIVGLPGCYYVGGNTTICTLQKYQTIHFLIPKAGKNFIGAHIVSNKPVAVFSGSKCTLVDGPDVDYLVEMIVPVNLLGNRYYTTHTPNAERKDVYIIVATRDDTTVRYGGENIFLAEAGHYVEKEEDNSTFLSVMSDNPILLTMVSKSNRYNDAFGQPSLTLLLPEKLCTNQYDWMPPIFVTRNKFEHYVAVVIDASAMHGLMLDGAPFVPDSVSNITNTTKVSMWARVYCKPHCLYHPYVTFFATLHGINKEKEMSYLCPAGFGRAIYCCEFCGDPHLRSFVDWRVSLPIPCAYLVTRLRLTNPIIGGLYEEIVFTVRAGNSKRRKRCYVSDINVRVAVKMGNIVKAYNSYWTGEKHPNIWKMQKNSQAIHSQVELGYNASDHVATLSIKGTDTGIQFRPIHTGPGGRLKDGRPFLIVSVGSAELIYDRSIEFPNSACSTVDDDPSDNHFPSISNDDVGAALVIYNIAQNMPGGMQDKHKCPKIVSNMHSCHPDEKIHCVKKSLALLH